MTVWSNERRFDRHILILTKIKLCVTFKEPFLTLKPIHMASIVPLTIQAGITQNFGSRITIGTNKLSIPYNVSNLYWAVVLDRTNLNVLQNFTFTDNQNIPAQLNPYINNSQYILILTTQNLSTTHLPTGNFYNFLIQEGAGVALLRIEQIYQALSCGTWGWAGYTLVCVMDKSTCYDFSDVLGNATVNTLSLMPIQVGTGVLYTPTELK